MHSPFTIVFPEGGTPDTGALIRNDDGEVKTMNLYVDYSNLTPEEVAASNQWYLEWTGGVHHQNLVLTLDYF